MAGSDAVAVDTVCALIEGWDPQSIGYLNYFASCSVGNAETQKILTLGEQVSGIRKNFSNKLPELGGVPVKINDTISINDLDCSAVDTETDRISFTAGEEAVKAELYINGYFIDLAPVIDGKVSFDFDKTGISGLNYTVKVIVYDRFMNSSEKSFILE